MVYKVSEIVKELGVSRQTVYKKLRREYFKKYIVDLNGITGVTEEGLRELKAIQFKEIEDGKIEEDVVKEIVNNDLNSVSRIQEDLVDSLNRQLALYEEQLKIKDKQLDEKDKQIIELIKVTENSQVLQKMILSNTEVKLLAYREELEIRRDQVIKESKKGVLNKIKKYFKD